MRFFCCGGLALFFAVGALWVFFAVGALCFFAVEALHFFFCCAGLALFFCAAEALQIFLQRGGWGGRSPPHLQTHGSHDGFQQDSYVLQHACTAQNKQRGGLGGAQPPPICKHNARTMGFNKRQRGGWGGRSPPHLQTHDSHDGLQQDSYVLKRACTKISSGGGWGGRSPPPFANTMLVRWASTRRICFEARFARR